MIPLLCRRKIGRFILMVAAAALARCLVGAQDLAGVGPAAADVWTAAEVRAAAANNESEAKEIPCEKNAKWESRVFLLRLKKGSGLGNNPREVRVHFNTCSRHAGHETEERWFSNTEDASGIGIVADNNIGSNVTSVGFFIAPDGTSALPSFCTWLPLKYG